MATEILCKRAKQWFMSDKKSCGPVTGVWRYLTSGEVSTALRPFYFTVHPDLFGQYPCERAVNEQSLQVLSSYIESLLQNRPHQPPTLKFYLKPQGETGLRSSLKVVNIQLQQRDVRKTVMSILSSCNLPTTYVENIAPTSDPDYQPKHFHMKVNNFNMRPYSYDYDFTSNPRIKRSETRKTMDKNQSLKRWLASNASDVREKLGATQCIREEVDRLREEICLTLEMKEILFDCGWNIAHFRGCLLSFIALIKHHHSQMKTLKGRTLVFGNDTGVSLNGQVLLNSGEVRHNWLDFIKNLHKEDALLITVPAFEKAVSRVLRDIRVVRRKFQPKTMVKNYENNLRRLTTSLSDHQGKKGYPKEWPASLDYYEIVIETEAGPLMVSPTGQFIVPASCPSFLLVNFISENLQQAAQLLHHYRTHKHIEKELHKRCMSELQLAALVKDDCITPDLMTACMEVMLDNKLNLSVYLADSRLFITNYYSIMSDGQMCIPWNFKL
uniref:DUF4460 domain-containing protein n=2 Tax=Clastoptera arizonana TaxID=38151 RepID=A0A1B6DS34_9HEMI